MGTSKRSGCALRDARGPRPGRHDDRGAEEYEPTITSGTTITPVWTTRTSSPRRRGVRRPPVDGGNNDLPSTGRPCTSSWPTRCGPAMRRPTTPVRRRADGDAIVVNKMDSASRSGRGAAPTIDELNPRDRRQGQQRVSVDDPGLIPQAGARRRGRPDAHPRRDEVRGRVVAPERRRGEIVDRGHGPSARSTTRSKYDVGPSCPDGVLGGPAREMERISTRRRPTCRRRDVRSDLRRVIRIDKPAVRVRYDLEVLSDSPKLDRSRPGPAIDPTGGRLGSARVPRDPVPRTLQACRYASWSTTSTGSRIGSRRSFASAHYSRTSSYSTRPGPAALCGRFAKASNAGSPRPLVATASPGQERRAGAGAMADHRAPAASVPEVRRP